MVIAYDATIQTWAGAVTSAWTDKDLFTDLSVPKGAVAEITIENTNAALAPFVGVRIKGSGITRTVQLHEAEAPAGSGTHATMHVQTDANGVIQYYTDQANVNFILLGWWTGVTYTETDPAAYQSPNDGVWTELAGFTANRVTEIWAANTDTAAAHVGGVRKTGSALTRSLSLHEAEGVGGKSGFTFMVKTSSTGTAEFYADTAADVDFHTLGYFSNLMDFSENWITVTPAGTVDTWQDWDLTAYFDIEGRTGHFLIGHQNTASSRLLGIRINNGVVSDGTRRVTEHEAEGNPWTGLSMCSNTDAGSIAEYYVQTTNANYQEAYDGYFFDGTGVTVVNRAIKRIESRFRRSTSNFHSGTTQYRRLVNT